MIKYLLCSEGMNQRNGTDVDAANAMKVFSKLGYKVKVYNDQTVEQMKQILISGTFCCRIHTKQTTDGRFVLLLSCTKKILYYLFCFLASKDDHKNCASFICVLLSHGDEGIFFGTDGSVELKFLTSLFRGNRCRSLVGKPKLFFIQVCLSVCFFFQFYLN